MTTAELEIDATIKLPALPEGWHYATVAEVGASSEQTVLTGPFGTNLGRNDFVDRGVPLLTISCLTDQGIKLDKALFVSEEKAGELERYRLREGDILFSRMASVGRAGIVGQPLNGALFNYHIMRLRLEPTRVEPKFFAAYVRGASQVRDYLNAVNHGATRDGINTNQLMNMPVAVAPISEQRNIVAEIEKQFSRLDEAVANLKRVKANLKRYRAAVLKAAVEGRLVPTEAELARREGRNYETGAQLLQRILETRRNQWIGKGKYKEPGAPNATGLPELPEGWVWSTYEQVGRLQLGRQRAPKYHLGPNIRPYLRVQNVFEDRLDLSDVMEMEFSPADFERYQLAPGDLLLNEGQSPELLGRPAIYRGELPGACFTNTLIRFRAFDGVSVEFALIVSRHHMRAGRFVSEGTITTNIAHLSLGRLATVEFPLPPIAEQRRIAAEIDRRMSLIGGVESEIVANLKRGERLRQAVLARLFTPESNRA